MNDILQRKAAKDFAARWKDKGYEKGESQLFWTTLLTDVFGITNVAAKTRGRVRNSVGLNPQVVSASISSFTFIVPSSAANAEPERPVRMIPVMIGPNSRKSPMQMRSAT